MTISTNDGILKYGTQDTVTASGGTSAVATGAYSAAADGVSGGWTNDDNAPYASFALTFQYPSGTITKLGITLMCRLMNINGTNDEPSIVFGEWSGHILGTFKTAGSMSATTDYTVGLGPVELPACGPNQVYEFYLANNCGVQMTAGWVLKATPVTTGPA